MGWQDIAKASRKEIQEWATAKLHPKLNAALGEAGMPFNINDGSFLGGEREILSSFRQGVKWEEMEWGCLAEVESDRWSTEGLVRRGRRGHKV